MFDHMTATFTCTCPDMQELADDTTCVPKVIDASPVDAQLSQIENEIATIEEKIKNIENNKHVMVSPKMKVALMLRMNENFFWESPTTNY